MSVAHQLRLLSARLGEAVLLFRYRARATEDDFAEAAYRWPDRRGREFVVGHVQPQLELVRGVAGAVGDGARFVEVGYRCGEVAEGHISEVRAWGDEVGMAEREALRLSAGAEELAGVAGGRGREAEIRARGVGERVRMLGRAPV
jgi:hypothetical protein